MAFKAGEKLALVLVPCGRDAMARNSQVLERIGIDLLGKIAMDGQVRGWIGVDMLVLRRMAMTES